MEHGGHRAQMVDLVDCGVLTISDTRTEQTDESGSIIRDCLAERGHRVVDYRIVPDEPDRVRAHIAELCDGQRCKAILTNGGTGVAARDSTIEAVSAVFDKTIDGYGELFRLLSYEEIGAAAMLSRAVAGVRGQVAVFCMPGSPAAVKLAMDKLIMPQLGHIVWLLQL